MQQGLKQRLVGGLVILALIVIFLPMLLQGPVERTRVDVPIQVPPEPKVPADGTLPPPDFTAQPTPGQDGDTSVPQPSDDTATADDQSGASTDTNSQGVADRRDEEPLVAAEQQPSEEQDEAAPAGRPGSWVVQVGAFSEATNAERLRERLVEAGFDSAYRAQSRADGEVLHRVRVGPVATRADAEGIEKRLRRSLELDGILLPR